MRLAAAASMLAMVAAETWMTCPPSFDARPGRSAPARAGPCESLMHLAAGALPEITPVAAGQRIKVGWVANNQAGGLVRLALVPASLRTDAAAFDRAVLKVACYGEDSREGASFAGFCSHPCNARGPWAPMASFRAAPASAPDEARYDTTVAVPTNLESVRGSAAPQVGPRGGELYVLQLKSASEDAAVSFSCAMLEVLPGTPGRRLGLVPPANQNAREDADPVPAKVVSSAADSLKKAGASSRDWARCASYPDAVRVPPCAGQDCSSTAAARALLDGARPGAFCFDGHADVDWDAGITWPVNAACDPRGSCRLAPSAEACEDEMRASAFPVTIYARLPNS